MCENSVLWSRERNWINLFIDNYASSFTSSSRGEHLATSPIGRAVIAFIFKAQLQISVATNTRDRVMITLKRS